MADKPADKPAEADEAQAYEANDAEADEADAEADEAYKAEANEADYVEKTDEAEADDADDAVVLDELDGADKANATDQESNNQLGTDVVGLDKLVAAKGNDAVGSQFAAEVQDEVGSQFAAEVQDAVGSQFAAEVQDAVGSQFAKADADDATEDNKANKAEVSTIIVYLCCLRPFPLTKYCAIFSKDKEYFCPRPIANNNQLERADKVVDVTNIVDELNKLDEANETDEANNATIRQRR